MSGIAPISLHIVRGGPAHNALLSPITPYIGLCGRFGVSTVTFPWEQAELLRELARLRYDADGTPGAEADRQYTLHRLGERLGTVLAQFGGLASEMAWAESRAGAEGLVHLRVRLWGSELSIVPFEVASLPAGLPGEGHRLALKTQAPVCLTRELVGAHVAQAAWDRPARVLFAWASPGTTVPFEATLDGIRAAVAQLVAWRVGERDAAAAIGAYLTVLPFASLEDIEEACAGAEYTHVYILAHGLPAEALGELRYTVALHAQRGSAAMRRVTGGELGLALGAARPGGCVRPMPSVVTLAICDGGNQGAVSVPGGSVAHALHEDGVGWVLASQFPLHFEAAADIARVWMGELLAGTDPRWALHRTRVELARRYGTTHDWGALVAYAAVPDGFDEEAVRFMRRQLKLRVKALTDTADSRAQTEGERSFAALEGIAAEIEAAYQAAARQAPALVAGRVGAEAREDTLRDRAELVLRGEFLGLWASARKRIGVAMMKASAQPAHRRAAERQLELSLTQYRAAARAATNQHWQQVQALSLSVVLGQARPPAEWSRALRDAASDRDFGEPADAIWGHGSVAELHLLASTQSGDVRRLFPEDLAKPIQDAVAATRAFAVVDPFPLQSLTQQLRTYAQVWRERVDSPLLERALGFLE